MDTAAAWVKGQMNRGKPLMVFDWDKAARLIRQHKAEEASAGLQNDWEWTGGRILADGKIVPREKTYTYLASTWAIPELKITLSDGSHRVFECYKMQKDTPNWNSDTYWPKSAVKILNKGNKPKRQESY